ncbi:MAG: ABC transporter permease [Bacteroidota bacterium]
MFDLEKWQEIFTAMGQNKLRTIATGFGVFWGIMMLVILLGAGKGLENGARESSILDAINSIWFIPQQTSMPYKGMKPGRRFQFTMEDLDYIRDHVKGIEYMSPENGAFGGNLVKYKNNADYFSIIAGAEEYFSIKVNQEYYAGRKINFQDNEDGRKVCVIGDKVAEVLFTNGEDPVGKYITIRDIAFRIIGLFHDDGWGGQFAERIYIPFSTYQQTFNATDNVSLFAVTNMPGFDSYKMEAEIEQIIRQRYAIHPDDEQALMVHNQQRQYNEISNVMIGIRAIIWFVSIGTLIAGIMGISNIMIIVVNERTREIGIRKALGATPGSIVTLVLLEALTITGVAGLLGLWAGLGAVEGVASLMEATGGNSDFFRNPEVNVQVVVSALAILVLSGLFAGWVPARRAARMRPIEALQAK